MGSAGSFRPSTPPPSDLRCIHGDSLTAESQQDQIYACILRINPNVANTILDLMDDMAPSTIAVLGSILAAASSAGTAREALDSLQIVYEVLSRTDGTPEQRRRALRLINAEK